MASNEKPIQEVQIWVSGRVQGVCFRMYTEEKARKLGLTGWVRNCSDGRVEILVQGEEPSLKTFIEWCHQGSPYAQVREVKFQYTPLEKLFSTFSII